MNDNHGNMGQYKWGRDFWDGAISMTPAAQKLHSVVDITSPYEANKLDLTLLVYCHNNEDTIIETLDTVVEALGVVEKSFEIIIVDDNSKDGSADRIRGFIAEFPRMNLILRINMKHKGLSPNYFDGAFIGCGKYYRLIHADNSEPVETMVDVLRAVGEADIVVPYYVSMWKKSLWQHMKANLYTGFINFVSGHRINCYEATHVHLRYNVMRWHSNVMGYAFQMDLLCRLLDLDFTCKQVPCRAVPVRALNANGGTFRIFLSVMHVALDIVLRRLSRNLPNR